MIPNRHRIAVLIAVLNFFVIGDVLAAFAVATSNTVTHDVAIGFLFAQAAMHAAWAAIGRGFWPVRFASLIATIATVVAITQWDSLLFFPPPMMVVVIALVGMRAFGMRLIGPAGFDPSKGRNIHFSLLTLQIVVLIGGGTIGLALRFSSAALREILPAAALASLVGVYLAAFVPAVLTFDRCLWKVAGLLACAPLLSWLLADYSGYGADFWEWSRLFGTAAAVSLLVLVPFRLIGYRFIRVPAATGDAGRDQQPAAPPDAAASSN